MASKENVALVNGSDLPISTKHSIEICNFIRGGNLLISKAFLEDVLAKKKTVPFKRYNQSVGHKPGKTGPGRYPLKACKIILGLLESLEVNAQNKGLDTAALYLKEVVPNRASHVWHYGRQRRRRMKLTQIFMLAEEAVKKDKKEKKKETKVKEKKEDKNVNQDGKKKEVMKGKLENNPKKIKSKIDQNSEVKK